MSATLHESDQAGGRQSARVGRTADAETLAGAQLPPATRPGKKYDVRCHPLTPIIVVIIVTTIIVIIITTTTAVMTIITKKV